MTGHVILCWIERFFAGLVVFAFGLAIIVGLVWCFATFFDYVTKGWRPGPVLGRIGILTAWFFGLTLMGFLYYTIGSAALTSLGVCTRH
jgi:hypothetical protein